MAATQEGIDTTYRISWTGYVRPVTIWCILGFFAFLFGKTILASGHTTLGAGIWVLWALGLVLRLLSIRAIQLHTDERGIWVYSGIFPWNKVISGVRWDDVDKAAFYPGLISWAFKSYKIWVGHRFTKSTEIFLGHVARGNEFVEHVNGTIGQR